MKRASSWTSGLLVSLVTLGGMLLLAEGVVRVFLKDETALFPRYHTGYDYGRYRLRGIRPSSEFTHTSVDGTWRFTTNSRGFRNEKEFAYDKPPGLLRVLALGDSHTQGYEVRQHATYAAVLERWLAGRGTAAEVINAGVSGYSNAEALAFLEGEGHRYAPDVVVLGFYANDFADNEKAGLFALKEGKLVEEKFEHLPGVRTQDLIYSVPGVKWLGETSYFYNVLFNGVWVFFKTRLQESATLEYAVSNNESHEERQLELAAAILERMKRFCDEKGIRLIVADIPAQPGPYRFASSLPPELRARLAASGVEVLDAGELLGALDGAAEFHVPHGHRHISELTHALIGAGLGARIARDFSLEKTLKAIQ